jgi:hypothetical protein
MWLRSGLVANTHTVARVIANAVIRDDGLLTRPERVATTGMGLATVCVLVRVRLDLGDTSDVDSTGSVISLGRVLMLQNTFT